MISTLRCYICNKYFPIIIIKGIFYYNTKVKVKIKVYQHSNIQQKIPTKYFCSKQCKNNYLSEILN